VILQAVDAAASTKPVLENLVASAIWLIMGFLLAQGATAIRRLRRKSKIARIYRLDRTLGGGRRRKILILHSAIFDTERAAYNYPAADTRAARMIAKTLEEVGLIEGRDRDFQIAPARDYITDDGQLASELGNYDLVLICSPKRNQISGAALKTLKSPRYTMDLDANLNRAVLFDTVIKRTLAASRDDIVAAGDEKFDYGLLAWTANPKNTERHALVIAGTHGAGTIGAALVISSGGHDRMRALLRARDGEAKVNQVLVQAHYEQSVEDVVKIEFPNIS
jgi:hypothetical protein